MENSILVLESGLTETKALRGQGAKPVSGRESEDFGEVLDDQLQKGEAQAVENQAPVTAAPPTADAQAAPGVPRVPAVTPLAVVAVAPELNPLAGSEESPVTISVNAIDVSRMSQATAGVPVPRTATADPGGVPATGTQAETLQAAATKAGQPASEESSGPVAGLARVAAAPAAGQSVVMNESGAVTGDAPLAPATSDQQTSSQTVAVAAAGVRGASVTNETARPQAQIVTGTGGKFESGDPSLSSTQQITALEAGQSLTERRAGVMSTTLPTAPVPAMAPVTQILSPSVPAAVLAPVVPQALPALEQPFGDGQWNNAFGQRIAWAVGQGVQSASLALNPEALGPVTVQIALRDDEASLRFNAAQGLTRDAIEAALPRLREMLQAGGLSLGQVDISGDAQARAGQRDTQQQGNGQATDSGRTLEDETAVVTPVLQYTSRGLVDTFV